MSTAIQLQTQSFKINFLPPPCERHITTDMHKHTLTEITAPFMEEGN